MAAAATQQFSLVVQLGISAATVGLELYSRVPIPTERAEQDGMVAGSAHPDRDAGAAANTETPAEGRLDLHHFAAERAAGARPATVSGQPPEHTLPLPVCLCVTPDMSMGGTGSDSVVDRGAPRGVTGVQRLAIRLYFVCSGFGTRMMWCLLRSTVCTLLLYTPFSFPLSLCPFAPLSLSCSHHSCLARRYSLNVALPYFTQLYGPEVYPRMLLGYNLGAIIALSGQVLGDARFDALYGPSVTTCFRVNLGVGSMFFLMLYFPHTANHPSVPVLLSAAVGVLDYFATGSLTQMASRVGGIVPTFFFLGQAMSGAFLFGFTSSVDWSVEEMAVDNVQHYKHSHEDVVVFFGYASCFVFIGLVAFNFLITSDVIKHVHGVPIHRPWYHYSRPQSASSRAVSREARQPLVADADGSAGTEDSSRYSSCAQSILAFRLTWPLQVGIVVLWVSLLSVQALFGLDKSLQEPLMFVNLFGLMTGMQLNVLFSKTLDVVASPKLLLGTVCAVMPTFASGYALQTLGVVAWLNSSYLRVGATACFYVLGKPQSIILSGAHKLTVKSARVYRWQHLDALLHCLK
jgi:hypothetical protein